MRKANKVSPGEWKIMRQLWQDAPLTIMELVHRLADEPGCAKPSVITMLNRLEEKGAVRWEQREGERARRYYPLLDEEQVARSETADLLQRVWQGRLGLLVSSMIQEQDLTPADLEELAALVERAKQERGQI